MHDSLALPSGFKQMTISSGIRASARRTPAKTALTFADTSLSYAALSARINQVANGAAGDLGLSAGQNAAILAPNCLEYIEIVCGVSDTGAAIATPNPRLTAVETAAICNDARARVLFAHPDCKAQISGDLLETVERIVWLDASYETWLSNASDRFVDRLVPEWSTFAIPYTSGTTGQPKGVMISHRSRVLGFLECAVEYAINGPDDHFYCVLPLCHGAGLSMPLGALFTGGSCEIAASFDEERALRTLSSGVPTGVFFVPTHFHRLFELPPKILEANRSHNLRAILSNAAPLPQATKEKIVDYFGDAVLHEIYGSTEAGFVSNLRPADQLRKTQCVGKAFAGTEIKLLDNNGQDVAPNEVGELFTRSPMLFNGYWNRPEQTDEALQDGWVTVGDLARMDEEGFLYIVGRKKNMVISGGVNIYPREIDEVLIQHPDIVEAAVIGAPDEAWGERLVAYIATRDGIRLGDDVLKAHCKQTLSGYKIPREFHFVDALPRNLSGKVLNRELVEKYKTRASSEPSNG